MIFPIIKSEPIIQVNEKIRLDATQTFASKGSPALTVVRIEPFNGAGFTNVTGVRNTDWFLDWIYDSAGTKVATLEVSDGVSTVTKTVNIEVVTEAVDGLWSSDSDLIAHEYDLMKWLPAGKSSWASLHRKAQEYILDWINSQRIWKADGSKVVKADLPQSEDLKQLSKFWTLELIFGQLSNRTDDVFETKRQQYAQMRQSKQNLNFISIDENNNDAIEIEEKIDLRTTRLVRR